MKTYPKKSPITNAEIDAITRTLTDREVRTLAKDYIQCPDCQTKAQASALHKTMLRVLREVVSLRYKSIDEVNSYTNAKVVGIVNPAFAKFHRRVQSKMVAAAKRWKDELKPRKPGIAAKVFGEGLS